MYVLCLNSYNRYFGKSSDHLQMFSCVWNKLTSQILSIQILLKHCGVVLTLESGANISGVPGVSLPMPLPVEPSAVRMCSVPDDLLIDLRAKLMVCLIHLKQTKCLAPLMAVLFR